MSEKEHPLPPSCPNCGHTVYGPFCAACGQKVQIETPTLFEFIHEYLHHYVALEGTLTRSLWALVTRPGKLTAEFIAGRRARYVKPLQLYVTISFIFFILFGMLGKLSMPDGPLMQIDHNDEAQQVVTLEGQLGQGAKGKLAADAKTGELLKIDVPEGHWVSRWADKVNTRLAQFQADPEAARKRLGEDIGRRLPYAVFIMMPLFALLLKAFYWRRGMRYGAHLVFTLHYHAFVFLAFLAALLPLEITGLLGAICLAYLLLAQRRVYGGRWGMLVLRTAAMSMLYTFTAGVVALGLLALTIVS